MSNAADTARIKALRRQTDTAQVLLHQAFADVLGTESGRRVLYHVIEHYARFFSPSYTGNSETYYNEGRRAVGFDLLTDLKASFADAVVQMMTENAKEQIAIAKAITTGGNDAA